MQNINNISNISFRGNIYNTDCSSEPQRRIKTGEIENDSFQYSTKKTSSGGFLKKITNVFRKKKDNETQIIKKEGRFIRKAERKIKFALTDFNKIDAKSKEYYDEAASIVQKIEDGECDDNIVTYALTYRGNTYRAAATVDDEGYVDKIIQSKNGKVHTIYDIKTPILSEENRIYKGENNQKVTADCYFYDKVNDKIHTTYIKNIKNIIMNFNAVYDINQGGMKRVYENRDNSPAELLVQSNGDNFDYFINYSGNNEEKISVRNLPDNNKEYKYQQTKRPLGINTMKITKLYSKKEKGEEKPQHCIKLCNPHFLLKEYKW